MSSTHTEVNVFSGGIKVPGGYLTNVKRTEMEQNTEQAFVIPMHSLRVWDAVQTNLPGTAATDDLAFEGNTFGTGSPAIEAGDLKAAGATTRYARFQVALPVEYDDAETVKIRFHCGMGTTVADTSCTIDLECYESDKELGIGSDLCTTAATTMNSTTFADVDFTITASGLVSGDVLDCRVAIACNDGATGTAVIPQIGYIALLCDVRG